MQDKVKIYHQKRRAFIIVPEVGIILAQKGTIMSHTEILQSLGLPKERVIHIIQNNPRGYFMDNTLVIYQGDSIKEGECWELQQENYSVVAENFADMEHMFSINKDTQIYLGVKRGKLGEVWEKVHPVSVTFFKQA